MGSNGYYWGIIMWAIMLSVNNGIAEKMQLPIKKSH